jgi:hypothetical protein
MEETRLTTLPTLNEQTTEIDVPRVEADSLGADDDEIPEMDVDDIQ